jgi:hypothetical protein
MSEITAIRKFPCPACGAEAEWNPKKQMLVCPYCGAQSPAEIKSDGTLVEENDLMAALRAIPDSERGWEAEKKTVRCQNCNAISVFDAKRVAQRCDFCGSPSLIAVDDIKAPIRPSALLPFKIAQDKVREDVRRWYGSHWFAPNRLRIKALTDQVHGLYLPYWTFDAHVHADWQADSGRYYYVENDKGEREQRVEWRPVSGSLEHFFDDLLVPASRGVHPKLLEKIAPFPTTSDITPYDPGYLSGWVVEQYQIDLAAAAQDSRNRMEAQVRSMCASKVPGDTYRNLRVDADYSALTFKHVLLPVWLLTYTYGAKTYQVVANGYTGKIAGKYPISWIKVSIVVAAVLLLIFLYLVLHNGGHTSMNFRFHH